MEPHTSATKNALEAEAATTATKEEVAGHAAAADNNDMEAEATAVMRTWEPTAAADMDR